jgi:uncharacterized protein YndB with AHSA1/START domain
MAREILLGIETHADRPTLVNALTTTAGLASFWTSQAKADPTVGSEATFEFQGAPMGLRFNVDRIDENQVAWTCLGDFPYWDGTTVTWSLSDEPEHGGTRVTFMQAGFADDQPAWEVATVAQTWAKILERLKVYAETGSSEPALG